ncbi:MAG TPA: DUF3137 domain-containing protein [Chitinophagaceae bacterium]|nr:DUF3137 domain-containing protein [Chitinophagaceae bacterium]
MEIRKSFDDFFRDSLTEILNPLEQERKKIAVTGLLTYFFIGATIILLIITVSQHSEWTGIAAFICLLLMIVLLVRFYYKRKDYVKGFKEKIIRRIIEFIDTSLDYKPGMCINRNDYENSGLFLKTPDRYQGDDYIEGKRDKTFFCFSELHTEYKVNTGKSSYWETIFRGIFFIADFNKKISNRTYVWSSENPQLNFFTKTFSSFSRNLEKVTLESNDFDKEFIVYGSDQVEARYILTPSFMERMMKLREMMGSGISFSFVDTNINVAVPIKENLFEPKIFSANDYQKLGDYYNTIYIVFDIIGELHLNDR